MVPAALEACSFAAPPSGCLCPLHALAGQHPGQEDTQQVASRDHSVATGGNLALGCQVVDLQSRPIQRNVTKGATLCLLIPSCDTLMICFCLMSGHVDSEGSVSEPAGRDAQKEIMHELAWQVVSPETGLHAAPRLMPSFALRAAEPPTDAMIASLQLLQSLALLVGPSPALNIRYSAISKPLCHHRSSAKVSWMNTMMQDDDVR